MLLLPGLVQAAAGRGGAQGARGHVAGRVCVPGGSGAPYASVSVYDTAATHAVTGTVSDSTGAFALDVPPGAYLLEISFLAFQPDRRRLAVAPGERLDLGRVVLASGMASVPEVVVRGQRPQMELSFDKRVFHVGKDVTTTGTSLLDVLDNVPSVTTDLKGNVSLRGSASVRILVDGKPSNTYRNGSAALRSLPANQIAEVQVITNPSARYEAEGAPGIINIVLKKRRDRGFHGSVTAGAGVPANHELAGDLNYRRGPVNWFLSPGVEHEEDRPRSTSFEQYATADTSYAYREQTHGVEGGYLTSLRGGADLHLSEAQTLTLSGSAFGEFKNDRFDGIYTDLSGTGEVAQRTRHHEDVGGGERALAADLEYENVLDGDEHKLTAQARFEYGREPEQPRITEVSVSAPGDTLRQRIADRRDVRQWLMTVDYTGPLGAAGRLEAGVRVAVDDLGRQYSFEERHQGVWDPLPGFANDYAYLQDVNAGYATCSAKAGSLAVQAGLRVEQTWLRTRLRDTGRTDRQSYADVFPSVSLTYRIGREQSLQVSYSRRIFRPRASLLLPYTTYRGARRRRAGNPDLKPEYAHAVEAGYLQYWSSGSLLASLYDRHRTGVVERITTLDAQGLTHELPVNLATENAWGLELTADQDLTDALKLAGSANLFRSWSKGSYGSQLLTSRTRTLNGRLAVTWQPERVWKAQASLRYRGPAHTTQGRRDAYGSVDAGVAKEILGGRARLSFNVADLFESRRETSTVQDPEFTAHRTGHETTRAFRLNLLYGIHQEAGEEQD